MAEWQVDHNDDDVRRYYVPAPNWSKTTSSLYCGNGGGNEYGSAMRFLNVTIPAGKVIDTAVLYLRCRGAESGTIVNTRIRAEKAVDPIRFTDAVDFDARVWTDEFINWDGLEAWSALAYYTSPDFKTVIQEVIDQVGWNSGQAMVILWDDWEGRSTLNAFRQPYSHDGGAPSAAKLIVTFSDPPPGLENKLTNMGAKMIAGKLI